MKYFKPFSLISILFFLCFGVCIALDCILNNSNEFKVAYTISVDQTGHGNFTKIQDAINSIPNYNTQWIRIKIFSGKYNEKVIISKMRPCIFLEGAGSSSTIIEWGDYGGIDTCATFTAYPDNIVAKGITFKNTYNLPLDAIMLKPALAARIYGDKSAFYHCAFIGIQDTLWDATGRHYFNKCYIEGASDFIFGYGQSIYEKCIITLNIGKYAPNNNCGYITAQGRNSSDDPNGFVFKNCQFNGNGKTYLGRAWGAYSRVIIYNSWLSDIVAPAGWDAWTYTNKEQNIVYMEVDCSGPGANTSMRVPWLKKLHDSQLNKFVNISYIDQESWIAKLPKVFQI